MYGRVGAELRQAGWHRRMNLSACPSSKCIKLQGQAFFARSNEPCTYKSNERRFELARKRQKFDLDAYGERRDSEQPKAANLSAWRIADRKETCTYKSKNGRVGYARKQSYKLVPVPEETSLSANALQFNPIAEYRQFQSTYTQCFEMRFLLGCFSANALQRKEKNYGRQ